MKMTDLFAESASAVSVFTSAKWKQEFRAFLRLRPSLLRAYRNSYVAIHRGNVVDSGKDKVALGLKAYSKFGYVPI